MYKKRMLLFVSSNSNASSWEVFDVVMAELDLGKKAKGSFLLHYLQAVQSKRKNELLMVSVVMREKTTDFKSAKLTSTFRFEGVHRK